MRELEGPLRKEAEDGFTCIFLLVVAGFAN